MDGRSTVLVPQPQRGQRGNAVGDASATGRATLEVSRVAASFWPPERITATRATAQNDRDKDVE